VCVTVVGWCMREVGRKKGFHQHAPSDVRALHTPIGPTTGVSGSSERAAGRCEDGARAQGGAAHLILEELTRREEG